jgi:hypothetical protein
MERNQEASMGTNEHLIGQVIPAGTMNARWLFVTRVDGTTVYGRRWSARSSRWTKTETWYSRDALFRVVPKCPPPRRPAEMSERIGRALLECHIDGEWYTFSGSPTGHHRLMRNVTPKKRLAAHWDGYVKAAKRHIECAAS